MPQALCSTCSVKFFPFGSGKCTACGAFTTCKTFKYCTPCAKKLAQCANCSAALGGVDLPVAPLPVKEVLVSKPRPVTPPPQPIMMMGTPVPTPPIQVIPTLKPHEPVDPFLASSDWAAIFSAAGICSEELLIPYYRLAVLRQVYRTLFPQQTLPSVSSIPDTSFLKLDLARLGKDLRASASTLRCNKGHVLVFKQTLQLQAENGGYKNGFKCDGCGASFAPPFLPMHCTPCEYDLCDKCALSKINN